MIDDKHILEAISLLDRINVLQHQRHGTEFTSDDERVIWHRPEDILSAISLVGSEIQLERLNHQLAVANEVAARNMRGRLDG